MQNTMIELNEPGPYTVEQLETLGIEHDDPPEYQCEYCGKDLDARCYVLFGRLTWFPSNECDCEGFVRAKEREEAKHREEQERRRSRDLMRIGIEPRYQKSVLHREEVMEFMTNFIDPDAPRGMGLFIHGKSGSGKTSLLSAIGRDLHDARYNVMLTSAADMLESIQETFDKNASTAKEIERYIDYDLLLIDDMGRESGSDWAVKTLYRIISKRHARLLSTVIASEHKLSALGASMSRRVDPERIDAILSRIKEVNTFVKLPDIDYRLSKDGFPMSRRTH